jgi:hypothetical protein
VCLLISYSISLIADILLFICKYNKLIGVHTWELSTSNVKFSAEVSHVRNVTDHMRPNISAGHLCSLIPLRSGSSWCQTSSMLFILPTRSTSQVCADKDRRRGDDILSSQFRLRCGARIHQNQASRSDMETRVLRHNSKYWGCR